MISYVIIEKGAVSLTSNTNLNYGLSYDVRANGVYVPNVFDAIGNNLGRQKRLANPSPMPGLAAGIQYNPNIKVKSTRMIDMIKEILKSDTAR